MDLTHDAWMLLEHMYTRHPRRTWYDIAEHIFAANGGNEYRRTSRAWGELTRKGLTETHVNQQSDWHAPHNLYKALTPAGLEIIQARIERREALAEARSELRDAYLDVLEEQREEDREHDRAVRDEEQN